MRREGKSGRMKVKDIYVTRFVSSGTKIRVGVGRTRSSSNETKRTLRIFFRCSGGKVADAIGKSWLRMHVCSRST